MNNKKNPLSPHIQIYSWHVSSIVSISGRITSVINTLAFVVICIWISSLLLGPENYKTIQNFLNSFLGKFILFGITWSFNFQILSEIRHFFWDLGYGFEIKTANLTGTIVIVGSFILTILIYILGRQII